MLAECEHYALQGSWAQGLPSSAGAMMAWRALFLRRSTACPWRRGDQRPCCDLAVCTSQLCSECQPCPAVQPTQILPVVHPTPSISP